MQALDGALFRHDNSFWVQNGIYNLNKELALISVEGSVRVDLLGGTLDIAPINLILKKALTLNLATSLKAKVEISPLKSDSDGLEIHSKDYNSTKFFYSNDFTQEMAKRSGIEPKGLPLES